MLLDGKANPMNLGHDLDFAFRLTQPGRSSEHYRSPVVAGAYQSIAVIGGSVSPARLQALQQNLEATRDTLQQADPQQLALLTREDLLGDLFHAGTLGYFAQYLGLGQIAAQSQERHLLLAPSLGTYGYEPRVSYFFGFPRSIEAGGVVMDLDRVAIVTDPGPSRDSYRQFVIQLGSLSSALEHAVPEQMFTTPEAPRDAVSAVKALTIAQSQGQRVYHLTQANQASLAHLRHDRGTMDEIRAALAVGKEVITHTDPIEVPGWRGAGYVILDPETGAGAWKIGGGANGGFLTLLNAFFTGMLDALLQNYRSPDSMFGPYNEIRFSKVANFLGKALTIIGFSIGVTNTALDGNLSTLDLLRKSGSAGFEDSKITQLQDFRKWSIR